jgi:hypothetical protein
VTSWRIGKFGRDGGSRSDYGTYPVKYEGDERERERERERVSWCAVVILWDAVALYCNDKLGEKESSKQEKNQCSWRILLYEGGGVCSLCSSYGVCVCVSVCLVWWVRRTSIVERGEQQIYMLLNTIHH